MSDIWSQEIKTMIEKMRRTRVILMFLPTFQKQIRNFGQFSFDMWLYVFLSRNPNNSIFFCFIRLNVSLGSLGPQTPNVKF